LEALLLPLVLLVLVKPPLAQPVLLPLVLLVPLFRASKPIWLRRVSQPLPLVKLPPLALLVPLRPHKLSAKRCQVQQPNRQAS
jgi:hypothetical protein